MRPKTFATAGLMTLGLAGTLALTGCSSNGDHEDTQTATSTTEHQDMGDGSSGGPGRSVADNDQPSASGPSVSGIAFDMADGSLASMDDYQGQVVLVVNVASRCGLTPQVADLENLQQAYAGKPFTVLAFPSASFNQEPLGTTEAAAFCADMGATYPVAAKIDVTGQSAHPLFATLAQQGGEPTWNFTKYLVAADGTVIARFGPRTTPTDAAVQAAIDRAL